MMSFILAPGIELLIFTMVSREPFSAAFCRRMKSFASSCVIMTFLPPVYGKLFSKRGYLVPFFDLSLRIPALISTGVCSCSAPGVLVSRPVLELFSGCFHPRVVGDRNSRRTDTGREPRGKRLSSRRDQRRGALFSAVFAQ